MNFCRLWIFFWVFFHNWWLFARTQDVLSLLGSDSDEFCLTNSSSALYYTTRSGSIHEGTKLLPRSPYFCDFETRKIDNKCLNDFKENTGNYEIVNSLNYENFPIFDMRWEGLPIEKLSNIDKRNKKRLSFKNMLEIKDAENFKVTISLRASEVHFVLCDSEEISEASCYWFILQGWNGTRSILRKCEKQISTTVKDYPDPPCKNPLAKIRHPEDYPQFLGRKQWGHVTLEKQGSNLILINIENRVPKIILQYKDPEDNLNVKYLLGHTKDTEAYYKIHMHDYLRTTNPSELMVFPGVSPMKVVNRKICFSVMVTNCRNCWTKITVMSTGTPSSFEREVSSYASSYGDWTEYKIELNKVKEDAHSFVIGFQNTLSNTYPGLETFWSIDNFRQCSHEEYRVSETPAELKSCHLLYPSKTATWGKIFSYIPDKKCTKQYHFGEACIPCDLLKEDGILGSCDKMKVCEFISNDKRCFCSPGYVGRECDKACEAGTYGYGCSQQCGNCLGNIACRINDGVCSSCTEKFVGPLCRKPKEDIILKNQPSIIGSSPTSCTVQLVNKEYWGELDLNYYLVQYQKSRASINRNEPSGYDTWKDCFPIREIDDDSPVDVEGLESSTTYRIRILIAREENSIKNLEHAKVPFSVCNTTCYAWTEEDIQVTPGNASVHIDLNLSKGRCGIKSYKWAIYGEEDTKLSKGVIRNTSFTVNSLGIFMSHKIIFSGESRIVKEFHTTESVPSEVYEIVQEESSSDSIKLKWKEPRSPNGIVDHYRIQYRKIQGQYCTERKWGDKQETKVTSTFVELTNLTAFSIYLVSIHVVNGKFESKGISRETQTAAIDTFSEDEGIQQLELIVNAIYENTASLSVGNLQCQNIQGPLAASYECECISDWCDSNRTLNHQISLTEPVYIKDLQPFSNYSCSILFCRYSNCKTIIIKEFCTKAAYPNSIRQLSVFSKGRDYIYLRWLPPFPPTGTLNSYRIITTCSSCHWDNKATTQFVPKSCARWPNFVCAELTKKIYYEYYHDIQIQASNKENPRFVGVYKKFNVYVKDSASDPPYGLKTKWYENNTLELLWNHPNITNGNLKAFTIKSTVTGEGSTTYKYEVDQQKEQLTYHIRLDNTMKPSRDVRIEVFAENYYTSHPAIKTDSSFPATPILMDPYISASNSTTSTITITLNTKLKNDDRNNAKYLFIVITDPAMKIKDQNLIKLRNIWNKRIDSKSELRLAAEINLNDMNTTLLNFVVGDTNQNTKSIFLNSEILNTPLQEAQYYNIKILLVNEYKKKYKFKLYSIRTFTQGDQRMTTEARLPNDVENEETSQGSGAYYALFLLLLLIPLIIIGSIIYYKRKYQSRPSTSVEKILEAAIRNQTQSRSHNEVLLLESAEPSSLLSGSNVMVKVKLSRKSTNPPNAAEKIYSKPVRVANFEEYVKEAIQCGELARQHSLFPRGQTQPWTYGSMKVNKAKNRYNNLFAYDHSRVKLEKIPGKEYSDYINASYIHGYNVPRAYIATQGPKSSTIVDFWRMIWQENVKYIVMLANIFENGKKKVEQYWPSINEELTFEDICIQFVSMETFADFEYKIFHVIRGNVTRKLEQLHFTSWPDHGVPLYPQSLVPFLHKILKIPQSSSSPIVVHCSAGVGRTGTILLSDICLRMAAKEGVVDMLNNLQKLREQRSNMVDNVEQYKLVHLIVLESLMGLHTSIPCNDIDKAIQKLINEEEYKVQMDYLRETEWQDQALVETEDSDEEFIIFPEKNRFQNIVPDKRSRIFLTRYPIEDISSSYINAVQVDGFRCPGRFIVTQQPLPNTLNDFWRMVVERHINIIVSLNEINLADETCCDFFPTTESPELRPADFILVKFGKRVTLKHYDIYTVHVWVTGREENFEVEIISFKKWSPESNLPSSCEEFLSFWEEADTISRRSKTILVTCYDGITASGVYVAMCFVIEKIKLEQECDVCLAVRNVRHNRKQFVTEESQFIFLYEAALRYINGFESYANFQNQYTY